MGFDFSKSTGEMFGSVEDVFFKGLKPQQQASSSDKVNLADLTKQLQETSNRLTKDVKRTSSNITINIHNSYNTNDVQRFELSDLEEYRYNASTVKNKR